MSGRRRMSSVRWGWKTAAVPRRGFRDSARELHAERLMMRAWQPADAGQVYDACQDAEIQRWTRVPSPYSMADADAFVAVSPERWSAGLPTFRIFELDGRSLLGSIGFVRSSDPGVLELGYWIASPARRRGVATDATRLVCDWAFEHPEAHRIEWVAEVGNVGSHLVAERSGFQFEGVLRSRIEHRGAWVDVWVAGLIRPAQPAAQQ